MSEEWQERAAFDGGLSRSEAEALADQEADDRHLCSECSNLSGTVCSIASLKPGSLVRAKAGYWPVLSVRHRCAGFAPLTMPPELAGRAPAGVEATEPIPIPQSVRGCLSRAVATLAANPTANISYRSEQEGAFVWIAIARRTKAGIGRHVLRCSAADYSVETMIAAVEQRNVKGLAGVAEVQL